MHVRSVPGKSPHFLRKYFSKSLSFGLCVLRGRQVVSVVVLNTCLCVVFLSNVSKGGWGRKKAARRGGGKEGGKEGLHFTAKGALSLKEESRWPPWDSVLNGTPF